MSRTTYIERRGELETYFDRTAVDAWKRLTSDAPVGRIRATVRAGRDRTRDTLLAWLGTSLEGRRVLDAGCGTGALSVAAARRGARVTGVDLSASLVAMADERLPADLRDGRIRFVTGDMLDAARERFDHVVLMDSLIHYRTEDIVRALEDLSVHVDRSILFTFAPRTPALTLMHAMGRLFPRGNRAPSIEPVGEAKLRALVAASTRLQGWRIARSERIDSGFYISQAVELKKD